jgi:hypothetical protein
MTDPSNIRRPSLLLTLAGVGSAIFFLLTDPRAGVARYVTGVAPISESSHPFFAFIRKFFGESTVDAVHQSTIPTLVGLLGSAVITLIGLRLMTRKSA